MEAVVPQDTAAATATAKAQAFAHRLVEFAGTEACITFFEERGVDLDQPNSDGWSVLMSACACGRDDLVGYLLDRTTNVRCATAANRTTALHLAALSANPLVIQELVATTQRQDKLRAIADVSNVNGDTPLMMACVAKNDVAARLLVEQLGADPAFGNAIGMNALMCAARLSVDEKADAAAREELQRRSLAIVELLLARGVPLDVTELSAGNSTLHFAVMSHNHAVVKRFLTDGATVDVSCKNKAGLTALDLAKRTNAHPETVNLLQARWNALEVEQARQRALAEAELVALGSSEDKGSKLAKSKSRSKHVRKTKRESASRKLPEKVEVEPVPTSQDREEHNSGPASDDTSVGTEPTHAESSSTAAGATDGSDGDSSEWHSVSSKKTRSTSNSRASKTLTKAPTRSPVIPGPKTHTTSELVKQTTPLHPNPPLSSPPAARQALDATTAASKEIGDQRSEQIAWRRQAPCPPPAAEDRADALIRSYEQLNAAFHRGFPMAGELELGVETLLIGSRAADRDLQPDDGLSISQVEALQEAHWQAYHYLNEKKLDLARVLEAQRVEAQFTLQQEILHLE